MSGPTPVLTRTGLLTSPKTELVRYDSTWSYIVSHNPQTDRFSAPYPELTVYGSSPFSKTFDQPSPSTQHSLPSPNAQNKREIRVTPGPDLDVEGRHRRLKFGDKILVENGGLTLGDVDNFFRGRSRPDSRHESGGFPISQSRSEIVGVKINRFGDEELEYKLSGDSEVSGDQIRRDNKVSFCPENGSETPREMSRGSGNFLRLRAIRDAEEGTSLRMASSRGSVILSISKGNNVETATHHQHVPSHHVTPQHVTEKTAMNHWPDIRIPQLRNSANTLGSRPSTRQGSILRTESQIKKFSARGYVAFEFEPGFSGCLQRSNMGQLESNFEDVHPSPHYREARPLVIGSRSAPSEEALIDRHEGHSREFEQLMVQRIKVDEKEEGNVFSWTDPGTVPTEKEADWNALAALLRSDDIFGGQSRK